MTDHKSLLTNLFQDSDMSINIDLEKLEPVSGGVVSLILATHNLDANHSDQQLVIKLTLDDIKTESGPFGGKDRDTLLDIAPLTHALDWQILNLLKKSELIKIPKVVWGDPQKRITVMRDFRADGFVLMQDLLVTSQLKLESASKIGRLLANLITEMAQINSQLIPVENPMLQAQERLDELLTFLRPNLDVYREIEAQFLQGEHLIPTDGHPKNMAINQNGEVMIFDFGRSIVADPQYVAPNFAAHIGLATLGGCFAQVNDGITYIKNFISSFNDNVSEEKYRIDEKWFVRYFTAELLHRGLAGRWIDKRIFEHSSLQQVERAVHDICIEVFRPEVGEPITNIDTFLDLLESVAEKIKKGAYKHRR